ncbi:DUF4446 family protein [Paenibacillus sp. LHD-117]|uniref:DUF4446 family protein n=1 Tax=Paenibacillus sp. LHD-117 TaxID=3071412 RepID=UPI0027DF98AF|nr:DUF4446 family protein [Paenibacillus sp. LHD-117]MDQ6421892.1 DUF4446 family protein [Paenibacillus sp. LHD-117]
MDEQILNVFYLVCMALAVLVIVLLIWVATLGARLKKLRKQYVAVMGNTGITNIEDVVMEVKNRLEEQRQHSEKLTKRVETIESELPQVKGKVGIVRFNPFSDGGSDLSFSLAIVNEEKDGAVFSSLHSRENSYVYAKPVVKGESNYPLTPEEKQAILAAK